MFSKFSLILAFIHKFDSVHETNNAKYVGKGNEKFKTSCNTEGIEMASTKHGPIVMYKHFIHCNHRFLDYFKTKEFKHKM